MKFSVLTERPSQNLHLKATLSQFNPTAKGIIECPSFTVDSLQQINFPLQNTVV